MKRFLCCWRIYGDFKWRTKIMDFHLFNRIFFRLLPWLFCCSSYCPWLLWLGFQAAILLVACSISWCQIVIFFTLPDVFGLENSVCVFFLLVGGVVDEHLFPLLDVFKPTCIGFKLFLAPFHQWTPNIYEGVRFIRQIPSSISIFEIFGFFKTP